jgi:hydroxyacylglutathione hydrolase
MGLIVSQIYVAGYDKNFSYVVYDDATNNAVIIDPTGDLEKILQVIETQELSLIAVLLTHTHHDHYDKLDELLQQYGVPVYVHEAGQGKIVSPFAIMPMVDGDELGIGESQLKVLHTPGHSIDAVCFYIDGQNTADGVPKVITGDTLFVNGCGRTTIETVDDLYRSLQRLMTLPDKTVVYAGHDYGTSRVDTIGKQKATNKYLLAKNLTDFKTIRIR